MRSITIIRIDIFHGSEEDSHVPIAAASFKKQNHYIVNLIVVVHSTENCCAINMKLWVPKKVVLFITLC